MMVVDSIRPTSFVYGSAPSSRRLRVTRVSAKPGSVFPYGLGTGNEKSGGFKRSMQHDAKREASWGIYTQGDSTEPRSGTLAAVATGRVAADDWPGARVGDEVHALCRSSTMRSSRRRVGTSRSTRAACTPRWRTRRKHDDASRASENVAIPWQTPRSLANTRNLMPRLSRCSEGSYVVGATGLEPVTSCV